MTSQPTTRDLVLAFLNDRERAEIFVGGRPYKWEGGSASLGPLRPLVCCRSFGLEVTQYTAEAWAAQVAWHNYWREHDYHLTDSELRAAAPPRPEGELRAAELVRVTWGQLRAWIAEDAAPVQLELELCAA